MCTKVIRHNFNDSLAQLITHLLQIFLGGNEGPKHHLVQVCQQKRKRRFGSWALLRQEPFNLSSTIHCMLSTKVVRSNEDRVPRVIINFVNFCSRGFPLKSSFPQESRVMVQTLSTLSLNLQITSLARALHQLSLNHPRVRMSDPGRNQMPVLSWTLQQKARRLKVPAADKFCKSRKPEANDSLLYFGKWPFPSSCTAVFHETSPT